MDHLHSILSNILPLVLIILFSWLFSFLARKKKQAEPAKNSNADTGHGEDLFDLFSARSGGEPTASQPGMEDLPPVSSGPIAWRRQGPLTPPPVTADPIKPKMWGA